MFDQAMKMKMKEKLMDALMDDMDEQQSERIKPKAMAVEVKSVGAKPMSKEDMMNCMEPDGDEVPGKMAEDNMSDDELKKLLAYRMGK